MAFTYSALRQSKFFSGNIASIAAAIVVSAAWVVAFSDVDGDEIGFPELPADLLICVDASKSFGKGPEYDRIFWFSVYRNTVHNF